MRLLVGLTVAASILAACEDNRVYQEYIDFEQRYWRVDDKPAFVFNIKDTSRKYNLYCNIRNAVSYPYSRLFVAYSLQDSTGKEIRKDMMNEFLFDAKTGKPFGTSGLGDLYDHQFLLVKDCAFQHTGKYKITFEQFMRTDTLQGILAVGLQIENATQKTGDDDE